MIKRHSCLAAILIVHDLHTAKCHLTEIEDIGIDDALFWQNLYFDYFPASYENTRDTNPVDFLISGIFAAHFVNAISPVVTLNAHPHQMPRPWTFMNCSI